MFILDTRESELIKILDAAIEVKQLPVADVWIGVDPDTKTSLPEGIIAERKSIADLEASILDGRYREQRGRILSYCQENNTRPLYILEGSLTSGSGRLAVTALIKFINRLVLHYQIAVIRTTSVQETAEVIKALDQQWNETDPQKSIKKKIDSVKVTDGLHIQKKVNASDHKQFAISCLAQCPGVSIKMAEALLDTFGTLKGVIEAPIKNIEAVKVGARKIGPVVSKRLSEILNQT
jgi:ERCC4-type nuclease